MLPKLGLSTALKSTLPSIGLEIKATFLPNLSSFAMMSMTRCFLHCANASKSCGRAAFYFGKFGSYLNGKPTNGFMLGFQS
ncbi:hypothetical protein P1X15_27520 [Runella sp. MFBS21]|uniref:hypothetical protein n=1 Tax=Runella sp. MFBS21 TaxID=3034018 RepID=UPI0023F71696|nr:hypothetical protein [Runella sp. MFBS21]MDF7821404.1 hypothetical protein [Runella sp. MFBS21]